MKIDKYPSRRRPEPTRAEWPRTSPYRAGKMDLDEGPRERDRAQRERDADLQVEDNALANHDGLVDSTARSFLGKMTIETAAPMNTGTRPSTLAAR